MHKDAVKVIVVDAADNILVLRRSGTHPYYPYHADFPGGDIEPDETIEEALIRELYEETGIMTDIEQLLADEQLYSPEQKAALLKLMNEQTELKGQLALSENQTLELMMELEELETSFGEM